MKKIMKVMIVFLLLFSFVRVWNEVTAIEQVSSISREPGDN